MTVDRSLFTRAMARVPAPVTIATTVDVSGGRWGFTGSSFSSLSLTPPLVLICLDKKASTHHAFVTAERFLVNVLAADQSDVALRFARSGVDRFADGDMETCEFGLPGLRDAAARVACALHDIVDGGDHSILIGRVEAIHTGDGVPLVYSDRSFGRPVPEATAVGAR
ncbi:flavin reductase family protein [Streptomyces olivaceoviridis]